MCLQEIQNVGLPSNFALWLTNLVLCRLICCRSRNSPLQFPTEPVE